MTTIERAPRLTTGAAVIVAHGIAKLLLSCDSNAVASDDDVAVAKAWVEARRHGAAGTTIAVAAELLAEVASELSAIHARSLS